MLKKNLIKRAESWQAECEKMPLLGGMRVSQDEMIKMSITIIKTICEQENITPYIALNALKMAADIFEQTESKKMPLLGYPRVGQDEMIKMSITIIKTICEQENITSYITLNALKMAADIVESEMKNDIISENY